MSFKRRAGIAAFGIHDKAHCGFPGFPYRCFSARQRNIFKLPHTFESVNICDQKFSAPEIAVSAIARAIERNPDDLIGQTMLRHDRTNVGIMMLDARKRSFLIADFGLRVIPLPIASTDILDADREQWPVVLPDKRT